MFQALRILPVLVVLGALALVVKAGGMITAIDLPEILTAERASEPSESQLAEAAGLEPFATERLAAEMRTRDGLAAEPAAETPAATHALSQALTLPKSEPAALPEQAVAEAPPALPPSPEAMFAPAAGGAEEPPADAQEGEMQAAATGEAGAEGAMEPSKPVRDPFDMSDEELELLQRLVERREELAVRARDLDEREALLEATEGRIADKMNELKNLQASIEGLLAKYDEEEEARLQSLVKIYENMKPKDAARIFEELDILVLLDVISRMKERKTAPILARMDPETAKTVTLELAQRRAMPFARE